MDYRYIYILFSPRYPFRYKIGIAKNVQRRIEQLQESMRTGVYCMFCMKLYFAEFHEGLLHFIYKMLFLHAPLNKKYDGHSEWFRFILPITPMILILFFWCFQRGIVVIITMFTLWLLFKK